MKSDIFARARMAAVQSRVAAPVVSGPIRHLGSPFHDGSYWCSQGPRRGYQSAKGLMRHITHHHTGSVVDKDTRAHFVAIERVTCSTPSCGGLRRGAPWRAHSRRHRSTHAWYTRRAAPAAPATGLHTGFACSWPIRCSTSPPAVAYA